MYSLDYKERPVDMKTFISSSRFLGESTNGGKAIYPVWKDELAQLMAENTKLIGIFTGAIGTGKTYAAYIGVCYVIHRLLCLKNPWRFYDKGEGDKMCITFFNLTKSLSQSKGFNLLQSFLCKSPWFVERGRIRGQLDKVLEFPIISYALASPYSQGFGAVGQSVVCAVMDELDDPSVSDKQKLKVVKAFDSVYRRFESRFVVNGESLGKMFLVCSKQEEDGFLNTFVAERKNSPKVHIVDIPIWEARPKTHFCGRTFKVHCGDVYSDPAIVVGIDEEKSAIDKGFKLLNVPIEYQEDFEKDIVGSLRDIAGVSIKAIRTSKLFPSEKFVNDCYDDEKIDPVTVKTIEIGLDSQEDLINYIDFSKIRNPKSSPRFIHVDISYSGDGDCLGLGMSGISKWIIIQSQNADGTIVPKQVPVIETDLAMRIKGKSGDQIPLFQIRRLVLALRDKGYNIEFSSDLNLLSADTRQLLERAGIKTEYLSLDKSPEPYYTFRSLVFEHRWICHRHEFLHFELINLEDDRTAGKIDHPDKVKKVYFESDNLRELVVKGSKDIADGVVGSVFRALSKVKQTATPEEINKIVSHINKANEQNLDKPWWLDLIAGDKKVPKEEAKILTKDKSDFFEIMKKCL